jgi:ferric-dicitrate binding protein FerR (iron transport regulator)
MPRARRRQRTLVFRDTPFGDIAEEFNRYNVHQIRIEDTEIELRRMSGTFSADQPQMVAMYLQLDQTVSVSTSGDDWVTRKR